MPPGRLRAGQIPVAGRDLIPLDPEMNKIRAREIAPYRVPGER
jgi:hypothetical protein